MSREPVLSEEDRRQIDCSTRQIAQSAAVKRVARIIISPISLPEVFKRRPVKNRQKQTATQGSTAQSKPPSIFDFDFDTNMYAKFNDDRL